MQDENERIIEDWLKREWNGCQSPTAFGYSELLSLLRFVDARREQETCKRGFDRSKCSTIASTGCGIYLAGILGMTADGEPFTVPKFCPECGRRIVEVKDK